MKKFFCSCFNSNPVNSTLVNSRRTIPGYDDDDDDDDDIISLFLPVTHPTTTLPTYTRLFRPKQTKLFSFTFLRKTTLISFLPFLFRFVLFCLIFFFSKIIVLHTPRSVSKTVCASTIKCNHFTRVRRITKLFLSFRVRHKKEKR